MTQADRILKVAGFNELEAMIHIRDAIARNVIRQNKSIINMSNIAKETGIGRTIYSNAVQKLELIGVVNVQSMGTKGTVIELLDKELLDQIVEGI